MDNNLQYLIECARRHVITASEREAQVRSFAYGNTHIENESITKADIEQAMQAERESEPLRS